MRSVRGSADQFTVCRGTQRATCQRRSELHTFADGNCALGGWPGHLPAGPAGTGWRPPGNWAGVLVLKGRPHALLLHVGGFPDRRDVDRSHRESPALLGFVVEGLRPIDGRLNRSLHPSPLGAPPLPTSQRGRSLYCCGLPTTEAAAAVLHSPSALEPLGG